jgi:hypothetical protein
MKRFLPFLINAAVVVSSTVFCLAAMELALRVAAHWQAPVAAVSIPMTASPGDTIPPELIARSEARHRLLTMPDEWKWRDAKVPGAARSYYWHGILHALDENDFRRTTPFPPKLPETYRIMVVGDSLTMGAGIAIEDSYVSLLNRWLGREFRAEVLNLGHTGYQSEDVVAVIRKFLPLLKPNLVIYAVCQNDFLPSGIGQYDDTSKYALPLPAAFKDYVLQRSILAAWLSDHYDASLRHFHLRFDFFDDILKDFADYQKRFARDVADMNVTVRAAGLPPMVAIVLDQYPGYGGRGYQITKIAERALVAAGADVIPTEDYYIRYNGQAMYVSRWEGHPDEVANFIWARMLLGHLSMRQDLIAFRRP